MELLLDGEPVPGRSAAAAPRQPRAPQGMRRARSYAHLLTATALPLAPPSPLNGQLSSGRHLACTARALEDLRTIERFFGTTINDVLLAASAGALRELLLAHDRPALALKARSPSAYAARTSGGATASRPSLQGCRATSPIPSGAWPPSTQQCASAS
jgi:wax ester synthase-like acyl-CoA acyltransferase family protein